MKEYRVFQTKNPKGQGHYLEAKTIDEAVRKVKRRRPYLKRKSMSAVVWRRDGKITKTAKKMMGF